MIAVRALLFAAGAMFSIASADTYKVKAGDTLYNVARIHNMDPAELMTLNKLPSTTIQVGQELKVTGTGAAPPKVQSAPAAPINTQNARSQNKNGVVRAAAMRFMGIPYQLGASGGKAIDCSAFTRAVMQQIGVLLPRTTREQFNKGTPVAREDLRSGDLVFFNTLGNGISHVGIYLGNGQFAHANSYLGRTTIDDISGVYYRFRYVGARRVLPSS
ncbi:C40 family peptidase [Deinococcus peraridilitoris]|nr:LysM peptidoglycan-binding domain-containing C40 family peptidase [Deinococcus peraridilitoris]